MQNWAKRFRSASGTLAVTVCFFLAHAAPALAQADKRLELFGCYASATQPPSRLAGFPDLPTKYLHGWRAGATGYITPRFGVETEVTGLSGTYTSIDSRSLFSPRTNPPIRQLTILAGPRFKLLHTERATATIHALAGTARVRRADPHGLSLPFEGSYAFGASFGGSFDLNFGPGVALRLLEPSFFLCAGRPECRERSFRIASGLIVKFFQR